MVEYHCKLCSYTTIYSTSYKKHLQSKKHLAKEKEKNGQQKGDAPKMHPDAPKMHPDAPKNIDNKTCQFCEKRFTRTTGLKKHLQICSLNKNVKNAPKMHPKCQPMSAKCQPNVSQRR